MTSLLSLQYLTRILLLLIVGYSVASEIVSNLQTNEVLTKHVFQGKSPHLQRKLEI